MSSDQQAYAKKMSRAAQVEVTSVDMSGESSQFIATQKHYLFYHFPIPVYMSDYYMQ